MQDAAVDGQGVALGTIAPSLREVIFEVQPQIAWSRATRTPAFCPGRKAQYKKRQDFIACRHSRLARCIDQMRRRHAVKRRHMLCKELRCFVGRLFRVHDLVFLLFPVL